MAQEDNFLRLDPYNFETEEEFINFWNEEQSKKERNIYGKRINSKNKRDNIVGF